MITKYFDREKPDVTLPDIHVFVNQSGYYPKSVKRAYFNTPTSEFKVVSEDGKVCFSGKAKHFGLDKNSGDDVYIADFTELKENGNYRVVHPDGYKSALFGIGCEYGEKALYELSRAYYFLRCGSEVEEKYAGQFHHPACHTSNALLWSDRSVSLDVSGGWHDAGDYGRYVTAGACAVAHLLYAYKFYPQSFADLKLNIPESAEKTPDILSECRYELEWLMKMQREDGAVYHKVTTQCHPAFVMPQDDMDQLCVFDISSSATADLAAVLALAAETYQSFDADFAAKALTSAEKSYKWLEENPDFVGFKNPPECNTGLYGENEDFDNRFWANAQLYSVTGNEKYHINLKKLLDHKFSLTELGYSNMGGFGALAYIFCNNASKDKLLDNIFRCAFSNEANHLAEISTHCGYNAAMQTEDFCWGSNMNLMKHAMIFAIADKIQSSDNYSSLITAQYDFLFGANATSYSFVTGCGEISCRNPHLRPAFADGIDECIPGMVSGGANRFINDPEASELIPKNTAPMKCYADDVACYSLNEITIYWNSPAVFTAAYMKNQFSN